MEQRWWNMEDRSRQIFGGCKNCLSNCSYARASACLPSFELCLQKYALVRLRSRVFEQIDAVKETIVTVAVELNLAYGSIRVLKVQPKNRLLRLFGVKLKRVCVSGV